LARPSKSYPLIDNGRLSERKVISLTDKDFDPSQLLFDDNVILVRREESSGKLILAHMERGADSLFDPPVVYLEDFREDLLIVDTVLKNLRPVLHATSETLVLFHSNGAIHGLCLNLLRLE
jgi:hypothetical protein